MPIRLTALSGFGPSYLGYWDRELKTRTGRGCLFSSVCVVPSSAGRGLMAR
jgi:hypothetical protein